MAQPERAFLHDGSISKEDVDDDIADPAAEMSDWSVGFIFLGSVLMLLLGSFHIVVGLAAIIEDEFYAVRPGFSLEMDATAWGWLHMIGGVAAMIASIALIAGSVIARLVAIVFLVLVAMFNFYSIPYYPFWSVLMFAMCLAILWSLVAHGHEFSNVMKEPQ
jgi:hypothetical protein